MIIVAGFVLPKLPSTSYLNGVGSRAGVHLRGFFRRANVRGHRWFNFSNCILLRIGWYCVSCHW